MSRCVFIASGCPIATSTRYRCIHLQEQLAALGHMAAVHEWYSPAQVDPAAALDHDLVVLYRLPLDERLRRVYTQAQARNTPVVFDTDDLIFEPALTHWHRGVDRLPPTEQEQYTAGVLRYQAALDAADFVTVTTPFLADAARRRGKIAFVHRNAVGGEMQCFAADLYRHRPAGASSDRIVIGYGSGTPTHDVDFAQAVPALLEVMVRYPTVELWIAGPLELPVSLTAFSRRIRRFPLTNWQGWFRLAAQFDINLAPLEDGNLFCRAKSEIKFIETGLLGVPTIASRLDAYTDAITGGCDGYLAASDQEWLDGLTALIEDAGHRGAVGRAARQTVMRRYSPAARTRDLAAILEAVASGPSTPAPVSMPHAPIEVLSPSALPTHAQALDNTPFVPLVLNWLVAEPVAGSGGHTTVFRIIRHLVEFGHECHVYIVAGNTLRNYAAADLQRYMDGHFMPTGATFHRWTGRVYDADATIATLWMTAYDLARLPNGGRPYYFVQDFEPFFYPMGSDYVRAENTYRLGLHCLTIGPWLADLLRTRYQAQADHFDFAVDTSVYYPRAGESSSRPRIAFYARPSTPRRAYELGLEALHIVSQLQPDVEIVLFGACDLDPPPPFPHTNLGVLSSHELAALYSSCTAGLVLSLTNPSLVPFEMMACRCPVVDVRNPQMQALVVDGETALLADPVPLDLATALLRLLRDPSTRERLATQGSQQVGALSWRASAAQVEAVFQRHAPPPAARCLARRTRTGDVATLIWQINRALDARQADTALVDELRSLLYQTLAEKARLSAGLARAEEAVRQGSSRAGAVARLPNLSCAPLWVVGQHLVTRLPLTPQSLYQEFRADRSHLCRIELLFAEAGDLHLGNVHIALYAGQPDATPLFDRRIPAALIPTDTPLALDFSPQTESWQRDYTIVITAEPDLPHGLDLWRFWSSLHNGATLYRDNRLLRGQLAFQAFYADASADLLPSRRGPMTWGAPPSPLHATVQAALRRTEGVAREALRLSRRAADAYRERGLPGLLAEAEEYLRWRLASGADDSS